MQDPDLAGDPVDGDAEAVGVEGDAARRTVRLARHGELSPRCLRRRRQLGQRDAGVAAHDAIVVHRHGRDATPGVRGGEIEDAVAQRRRAASNRVAGDEHAGAGEGAGVEAGAVGVGLDERGSATAVVPSMVAAIWTCAVVVPSPNSTVPTAIS